MTGTILVDIDGIITEMEYIEKKAQSQPFQTRGYKT